MLEDSRGDIPGMNPTGNTRIYDGLPALILGFALVAMFAPVGCDQGSNVVEEGRYPPPDEGEHRDG